MRAFELMMKFLFWKKNEPFKRVLENMQITYFFSKIAQSHKFCISFLVKFNIDENHVKQKFIFLFIHKTSLN